MWTLALVVAHAITNPVLFLANDAPTDDRKIEFARDVQPIFARHCLSCHNSVKQEAGFRLDRGELAVLGGDSGKAFLPGKSGESRLIHYVAATDSEKVMPPDGERLSSVEIEVLRAWIDQGAKWPETHSTESTQNQHWAYRPLKANVPPQVFASHWIVNPIDQFILAKLESHGLVPSPEADRYTLIRRLSLDLIGLLPTVAEVDAFVSDSNLNAYEKLVERLLDSPHFGERWGRHWLDMARYADSDGYEKDNPRPDAYLWRDWVIDAVNADMPFDQFTVEQIAGDLLPQATQKQRLATAFHRQTLTNTEGGADQEQFRVEACFDRTETTGAVWLGLTVGCARCHSHKYDAISQREYYQLFAFYNNGDEQNFVIPKSEEEIREYETARAAHESAVATAQIALQDAQKETGLSLAKWEKVIQAQIENQPESDAVKIPKNIAKVLKMVPDKRNDSQRQELLDYFSGNDPSTKPLVEKLNAIKKKVPVKPEHHVRVIGQRTMEPRKTFVLRRGEFLEPVSEVEIKPSGLSTLQALPIRNPNLLGDRLDLAQWLVSKENPLTPRVTVNHVWRTLFGTGIVKSANDFGIRGDAPSHPELLDWLARNFVGLDREPIANAIQTIAWSRKELIKQIVMSATYRQSSKRRMELSTIDPENQLLACQNRLRVEGEIVRDISLDAAGLLARTIGGPSVFPALPPGIAELSYAGNFKWTVSKDTDRYRRGMDTFFKRTAPHPNLITFDCPDANLTCVDRNTSNTPLQALVVLNNESFVEAAQGFAKLLLNSSTTSDAKSNLVHAFRICLARPPKDGEVMVLLDVLEASRRFYAEHLSDAKTMVGNLPALHIEIQENAAWIATVRVLLNLDEFITRE